MECSIIPYIELYIVSSSRKGNEEHQIDMVICRSVFLSLSVLAQRPALSDISFYLFIAACALKRNGKRQTLFWIGTLPPCSWLLYIYLLDSKWEECALEKGCSQWFNINLNNVWTKLIMLSHRWRDHGVWWWGCDGFRARGRREPYTSTSDWYPLVPSVKTVLSHKSILGSSICVLFSLPMLFSSSTRQIGCTS